MKSLLSASALVIAAAIAAPAMAGDGYLDLSYGQIDADSVDLNRWQVGGAVSTEIGSSGMWNVQADGHHSRLDEGSGALSYSDGSLHAFHRNDQYAAGAYVSAGDFQGLGSYGVGVEGNAYFDRITLSGRVGYEMIEMFSDNENGWSGSAGARLYMTDNAALQLGVSHIDIDDFDITSWSIGGEFKPESTSASFFADYSRRDADVGFLFFGDDVDTWRLGVRWNFGGGTLHDRDRNGPTMGGGSAFVNAVL